MSPNRTIVPGIAFLFLFCCRQASAESLPPTTQATEASPDLSDQAEGGTASEGELRIKDIDLLSIDIPMVVTATRREQRRTALPYAVSVITAEDIRQSGARSVPDALRLAAGVDVAEMSYGVYGVSPRGLHGILSGESLVLVDGRQIFDSFYGGTWWGAWPFQLEDIERIEVIRGPGGVTWGADAVQGVINIITKDPKDQLGLTVTGGGGSRGVQKEHLGYGFADEKLRLRVSGEYEGSDGFNKGGSRLIKLDDDYQDGRIGLHAIYEAGPDDRLTLSAGSNLLQNGFPPGPMAWPRPDNAGSQANYLLTKWSHQIETDNRFELTGFVNDFQFSPGFMGAEYRYQQFALQFGHTLQPAENHTLTWGLDTRTDLTDTSNSRVPLLSKDFVSTAIIGAYIQDEWRFAQKWTFSLGGRLDYEFYGGFQPSARTALSYELAENSLLYGAISRAFHVTPAAMRFTDTPLLGGLARMQLDREMDPITLLAYDLGHHGRFFDRLDTNLSVFWHEYNDCGINKIKPGPPGLMIMNWDNGASASLYGVELDAKYAASKQLTLLGNYTFQKLDWRPPKSFDMTESMSPPEHKFMLGARYSPTDDLHLSSHLYYVDAVDAPNPNNPLRRRQADPYFRLDLRGEYEFWKDRASVAIGVRNLLDPQHYEGGSSYFNDAEAPRMVYAELRVTVK